MEHIHDMVGIGGGPAGLTAAIYLARAKYRVVVVEKEMFGGQITITHEVVNYPGIGKTSGKALTDTMQQQAEAFGAETIDYSRDSFVLRLIGDSAKMDDFIMLMKDFTILEICRTGTASLEKGGATLRQSMNL